MTWILLGVGTVFVLAAGPTLYTIFGRHIGFSAIGTLWRFGPHQFMFTLFVVPFTTYFTGCALWWTVQAARATGQPGILQTFASDWPIAFLWSLALGGFIAGAFYIGITWSPDKLKAPYAKQTAIAIESVEDRLAKATNGDINSDIAKARASAPAVAQRLKDEPQSMSRLSPIEQLQILMSGRFQRSLRLPDEAATSFSGLQVWIILSLGLITLMCSAVILLASQWTHIDGVASALNHARLAALFSLASVLLYTYLFGGYREELERIAGSGLTSNQDLIAAVGIGICFVLLLLSIDKKMSGAAIPGLLGLAAVVAQFVGASRTAAFRTLFGWNTRVAIQLAIIPAIILVGITAAYAVRPQSSTKQREHRVAEVQRARNLNERHGDRI